MYEDSHSRRGVLGKQVVCVGGGKLALRTQKAFFLDARRIIGTGSVGAEGASGEGSTRKADAGQTAGTAACADKKSPGGGAVRA